MDSATSDFDMSPGQKAFLEEHPHSKAVPSHLNTLVVYEYAGTVVNRYILISNGFVLRKDTYPATEGDLAEAAKLSEKPSLLELEELWDAPSFDDGDVS